MSIQYDENLYSSVAVQFRRRVLRGIALAFKSNGLIDPTTTTQEDRDLIYTTAFNVLVTLEAFNGVVVDGSEYVSHTMFSTEVAAPDPLIASTKRTDLHGGLGDADIEVVLAGLSEE